MEKILKQNLPTNELEKYIEKRYEEGASQEDLDFLETQYAEKVSEESPGFLDEIEDDQTGQDGEVGMEENLAHVYEEYVTGIGYQWEYEDLIGNMRGIVDDHGGSTKDVSDEELFNIAKKLYEERQELLKKYKNKSTIGSQDRFHTFLKSLERPNNAGTLEAISQGYSVLFEGMTVKEKYEKFWKNKISPEYFNKIVEADPTKKKAFVKWMVEKLYVEGMLPQDDLYKATRYLKLFSKYKNFLPRNQQDIMKYSSLTDLLKVVKPYMEDNKDEDDINTEKVLLASGEAEMFYEDEEWKVIVPKTLKASIHFGSEHWCTTKPNQFESHIKKGRLYINIDKKGGTAWQFHFETDQFMDWDDQPINPFEIEIPEALVKKYFESGELTELVDDFFARQGEDYDTSQFDDFTFAGNEDEYEEWDEDEEFDVVRESQIISALQYNYPNEYADKYEGEVDLKTLEIMEEKVRKNPNLYLKIHKRFKTRSKNMAVMALESNIKYYREVPDRIRRMLPDYATKVAEAGMYALLPNKFKNDNPELLKVAMEKNINAYDSAPEEVKEKYPELAFKIINTRNGYQNIPHSVKLSHPKLNEIYLMENPFEYENIPKELRPDKKLLPKVYEHMFKKLERSLNLGYVLDLEWVFSLYTRIPKRIRENHPAIRKSMIDACILKIKTIMEKNNNYHDQRKIIIQYLKAPEFIRNSVEMAKAILNMSPRNIRDVPEEILDKHPEIIPEETYFRNYTKKMRSDPDIIRKMLKKHQTSLNERLRILNNISEDAMEKIVEENPDIEKQYLDTILEKIETWKNDPIHTQKAIYMEKFMYDRHPELHKAYEEAVEKRMEYTYERYEDIHDSHVPMHEKRYPKLYKKYIDAIYADKIDWAKKENFFPRRYNMYMTGYKSNELKKNFPEKYAELNKELLNIGIKKVPEDKEDFLKVYNKYKL